jgi:hypothetical protein
MFLNKFRKILDLNNSKKIIINKKFFLFYHIYYLSNIKKTLFLS